MARVRHDEVVAIIDTDAGLEQVQAAIGDASTWVDAHLVGACSRLTDALLVVIEKYLAAHLLTARDPRLKSAKRGDVSETYVGSDENDQYILTAARMDPCGIVRREFLGSRGVLFRVGAGYDSSGGP